MRWVQKMISASGDEEKLDKGKLLKRLETVVSDYGPMGTTSATFISENPKTHSLGISNIQNELRRATAQLARMTEERTTMRKELERRKYLREDKGTQTWDQEEITSYRELRENNNMEHGDRIIRQKAASVKVEFRRTNQDIKRKKENPWRDSGYLSSDEEDSGTRPLKDQTERNIKRMASIYMF